MFSFNFQLLGHNSGFCWPIGKTSGRVISPGNIIVSRGDYSGNIQSFSVARKSWQMGDKKFL